MAFLLISAIVFLSIIYYIVNRKFNYWATKGIPHLKPTLLLGNFVDLWLAKISMPEVEDNICKKFPNEPVIGAYYGTEPCLIVKDPEYIKTITTKDFYYFSNREVSDHVHKEMLMKNLFQSYGDEWKVLRQNLTPVFSSAKMKKMFYLIEQCSKTFEQMLNNQEKVGKYSEVRQLMSRFTMDCIGSCAFGINTNAMDENDTENPFRNIATLVFEINYYRFLKIHMRAIWPTIFYALGLTVTPKKVGYFFYNLLFEVFRKRGDKPSLRNDFVDLIMEFNKFKYITGDSMKNFKTKGKDQANLQVDHDFLSAQCFLFFAAGFETSASTSSFTLYELAKKPEAQEKVREEIDTYLRKHDGVLGYECITELPYLDQCIDEALRLYPVLGVITREVVEPYTFPDIGLTLEKKMRIHLPVHHLHRDPKYFPNPDKFLPERFSPEGKKKIVPYTYLPFGEGPRICIGMRFAKMQVIAGLITVLKKYRVELADDMPKEIVFQPRSFITQSKHGINLKFLEREDCQPVTFS